MPESQEAVKVDTAFDSVPIYRVTWSANPRRRARDAGSICPERRWAGACLLCELRIR